MQTTTLKQLEAAFIAAIHAIDPTYDHQQDQSWHYCESALDEGITGKALRDFVLDMGPAVPRAYFHGTGESFEFRMGVRTSYAGVLARLLSHMLTADAVDVRSALDDLRDPTVPGLYSVEYEGMENAEIDDNNNAALDHMFTVVYNQATS